MQGWKGGRNGQRLTRKGLQGEQDKIKLCAATMF